MPFAPPLKPTKVCAPKAVRINECPPFVWSEWWRGMSKSPFLVSINALRVSQPRCLLPTHDVRRNPVSTSSLPLSYNGRSRHPAREAARCENHDWPQRSRDDDPNIRPGYVRVGTHTHTYTHPPTTHTHTCNTSAVSNTSSCYLAHDGSWSQGVAFLRKICAISGSTRTQRCATKTRKGRTPTSVCPPSPRPARFPLFFFDVL